MKRSRKSLAAAMAVVAALLLAKDPSWARPPAAQELAIDHFDGFETWPLITPGDVELDTEDVGPHRIELRALFPTGPDGQLAPTKMLIDLLDVYFRGDPALWIQHTSAGRPGTPGGTGVIDFLVVDRDTFRMLHRYGATAGAQRDWVGPHYQLNFWPDRVVKVTVQEDGATETEVLEESELGFDTIDFATLSHFLAFIDLDRHPAFRVPYYRPSRGDIVGLPVRAMGPTTIEDARGVEREVQEVQVLGVTGQSLIEFWITEEPPYFYGWHYRRVADGSTVNRWDYVESIDLSTDDRSGMARDPGDVRGEVYASPGSGGS